MEKTDDKKKKSGSDPVNNITIGIGQAEIVQRHGEAAGQIIQAFTGRRYDSAGNELLHKGRSLDQISKYKVNPDYANQNLKQQSGFAAELLEEANRNKEAILNNDPSRRRTTDGIGKTNDTKYDLVTVGPDGSITDPSQMKFLGVDAKGRYSVIEKLAKDVSWDRYDGAIDVPKDQYEAAKKYANDECNKLRSEAKRLRELGKTDKALEKEQLADRYEKAGKRIRPSSVTEAEALAARTNPKKYVAKSILKDAHNAGKEAAEGAILVSGVVSLAQNICAVCTGDLSVDEAAGRVISTTAKAGATAYGVGSAGGTIKAIMHTSKNDVVRKLSNTTLPTAAVTATIEIASVVKAYASGELSGEEAFSRLGKNGVGSLAATYGGAVGMLLLPGIGGIVGSMVGYMISSALYDSCLQIIVDADLAHEEYDRVKELCYNARASMQEQRIALQARIHQQLADQEKVFYTSLGAILNSIDDSDTADFTAAISQLATAFGKELQFKNYDEFDQFMLTSDTVLKF